MSSIASLEHPSNHARLQLWQKSLALIRQKPLLGVGAGNWKVEILSEGADDLVIPIWRAYPTYTHNELLQLWAESGTVGLILFLSLVAALGLHLVKSLAKSTVPDVCIPLAISLWGLGCFLIVGQFDFPFQQAVPLSLLGVLVGMGIAQTAELRDGRSRAISYLPIMLCALFSCFVFIQRTAFEARLSRWDRALRKGSFAESQPRELRWYTLDPSATPPGNYTATALLHQGRSNDALTVLRKALRHNPNNLLVQNNIAAAFLKLGMLDSANQYVDRIQSICSAYPDALINKSILFLHRSELDSASFTLSRVAAERRNGQWLQLARLVNSRLETGYNGQEAGIH
jgi:tetratricopeptide (TPR) repeat protein